MADSTPASRGHPRPLTLVPVPDPDHIATPESVPLTSFIGRTSEIDAAVALLLRADVRLLTLTGPGGIGKTRLALRVVETMRDTSGEASAWVSLAPVRDPDLVLPTIAQSLDVPHVVGESLLAQTRAYLQERRLLLVLDNAEHLLDAVAPLVANLLATCPRMTVFATSRSRLNISGERVVPVASLDAETARSLFALRAEAVDPAFAITSDTGPVIDVICDRLDRLPLAIELAAARVSVLPPRALLTRLDHRLPLLTGGPRDGPDRQRDMRATIAWSHDLLSEPEQVLFRRLGVFVGGFPLDAAEAVGGPGTDALTGVTALVASSLLAMLPGWRGEPRYAMLETIREDALERLDERGDGPATRLRFATWCSDLAASLEAARFTDEELDILDRLEWDISNLREVLGWYERSGDRASMLRMAGSLESLWAMHGHGQEGRVWLERATEDRADVPAHVTAVALRALSRLLNQQAVRHRALALAERALELSREEGDQRGIVSSLILCGIGAFLVDDIERAIAYQEDALALLDASEDQPWTACLRGIATNQLGNHYLNLGAIGEAESWYARAADLDTVPGSAGSSDDIAIAGLGDVARAQGNNVRALQRYREGLRLSWDVHDLRAVAYALGGVAGALAALGHHALAARLFGLSEVLHENLGRSFVVETFDRQRAFGLPEPWAAESTGFGVWQRLRQAVEDRGTSLRRTIMDRSLIDPAWQAGRVMGAQIGSPRDRCGTATVAHPGTNARTTRGEAAIATDWDAGSLVTWDEVLAEVAALLDAAPLSLTPVSRVTRWGISPREFDVLCLLAEGRTDREIADALFLSPRTVNSHVSHLLAKLGVPHRRQAITLARNEDLLSDCPALRGPAHS